MKIILNEYDIDDMIRQYLADTPSCIYGWDMLWDKEDSCIAIIVDTETEKPGTEYEIRKKNS